MEETSLDITIRRTQLTRLINEFDGLDMSELIAIAGTALCVALMRGDDVDGTTLADDGSPHRGRWLQLWNGANAVAGVVRDVVQGRASMPETMKATLPADNEGRVTLTMPETEGGSDLVDFA